MHFKKYKGAGSGSALATSSDIQLQMIDLQCLLPRFETPISFPYILECAPILLTCRGRDASPQCPCQERLLLCHRLGICWQWPPPSGRYGRSMRVGKANEYCFGLHAYI